MVALGGLMACGGPTDPVTTVQELRVVSVVSSAPEVRPGETFDVTVHLLDAEDGPRDVALWFCTLYGDSCAEAGPVPRDLRGFSAVWSSADLEETATFTVPGALGDLLSPSDPWRPMVVWALACRPGVCGVLDALRSPPPPGSDAWWTLVGQLARPAVWLQDLPGDESALSARTWVLSDAEAWARHTNPRLVRLDADGVVRAQVGERVVLTFEATGGSVVYPMATGGGFERRDATSVAGRVDVAWVAPGQPGGVDLVVLAEDGAGGADVWRGRAVVEAP